MRPIAITIMTKISTINTRYRICARPGIDEKLASSATVTMAEAMTGNKKTINKIAIKPSILPEIFIFLLSHLALWYGFGSK